MDIRGRIGYRFCGNCMDKSYLKIGYASDLPPYSKERMLFRFFEIIPGFLIWGTFILMVLGAWFLPLAAAIFIILFDLYWFLKSLYFSWHLRRSFRVMQEYQRADWPSRLEKLDLSSHSLGIRDWKKDVWHLLVLPFYKEGYDILRHTIEGILNADYSKEQIVIVLSGEERSGNSALEIMDNLYREFGTAFGGFLTTLHKDQPGELAGKGANEAWATRYAKREFIDPRNIRYERVIVSVFDADTIPSPEYFLRLSFAYLTAKKPLRTSFQPVPLFINNIWEAPALARVISFSSTFWHLMNQMRPERLVSFSSHAFPLKALVEMDFWQTNVVSEDSRIFWQGLLKFDGDWRVLPLLVPVAMDANVAETFWRTLKNIYLQQRRWAFGAADIAYFLYGFRHNKKIPLRAKFYWTFHLMEGFWSWATNSILIFLMGWLIVWISEGTSFGTTLLAHNIPRLTGYILGVAMLGIITSIYMSIILLPPKPALYGRHRYVYMALQWIFIPITLIFFASLPAIDAQTRLMLGKYLGFWPTPKIRKGIQKTVFVPEKSEMPHK